jgi:hypothetical protein
MKYQIVRNSARDVEYTNDILKWAKANNYRVIGRHYGRHTMPDLRGQPEFKGLCGPIWGGAS